jgi:hypothetical protein
VPNPDTTTLDHPIQPWQQALQPGSYVLLTFGPALPMLCGQIDAEHTSNEHIAGTWFSSLHPDGEFGRYHRSLALFEIPVWLFERERQRGWPTDGISGFDLLQVDVERRVPPRPVALPAPSTAPADTTERQRRQIQRSLLVLRQAPGFPHPTLVVAFQKAGLKHKQMFARPERILRAELSHDGAARILSALEALLAPAQ